MKLEQAYKNARLRYKEGNDNDRQLIRSIFGEDVFTNYGDVRDHIKTFEDACEALNLNPEKVFNADDEDHVKAYKQLVVIIRALNEVWTADFANHSQAKYQIWWTHPSVPGGGFSYHDYGCDSSNSYVGSRLCFANAKLAEYCAKQFVDIWNKFLL